MDKLFLRWHHENVRVYARLASLLLALATAACDESARDAAFDQYVSGSDPTHVYRCESNRAVAVSYPSDDTAAVLYQGRTLQMNLAVSASGARYAGDGLEWWSKGSAPGSEGTLFRHNSVNGATGEAVERCRKVAQQ